MRPICTGGVGGAWRTVCTAPAFAICAALCAEAAAPARHAKLRTKMGSRQRADGERKTRNTSMFPRTKNTEYVHVSTNQEIVKTCCACPSASLPPPSLPDPLTRLRNETCPVSTGGGTRRVRLVRKEGRGVSSQYGKPACLSSGASRRDARSPRNPRGARGSCAWAEILSPKIMAAHPARWNSSCL
jgi:hypothetical protein